MKKANLIMLGAPGSGKGTRAVALCEVLGIVQVSTGDLFRYNIKQNTELGKLAKSYINKGELVPDDVTAAMRLKNKVLHINRADVQLPEGRHFLADLVGLTVIDDDTGETIGAITEVLTPPAHEVYVVKGEKEYLIPAVDEFLVETNVEEGYLRVRLIEGMES